MSASGTHAHPTVGAVPPQRLGRGGQQPAAVAAPPPARLDQQRAHLGDRRPSSPPWCAAAQNPTVHSPSPRRTRVPAAGTDRRPPGRAGRGAVSSAIAPPGRAPRRPPARCRTGCGPARRRRRRRPGGRWRRPSRMIGRVAAARHGGAPGPRRETRRGWLSMEGDAVAERTPHPAVDRARRGVRALGIDLPGQPLHHRVDAPAARQRLPLHDGRPAARAAGAGLRRPAGVRDDPRPARHRRPVRAVAPGVGQRPGDPRAEPGRLRAHGPADRVGAALHRRAAGADRRPTTPGDGAGRAGRGGGACAARAGRAVGRFGRGVRQRLVGPAARAARRRGLGDGHVRGFAPGGARVLALDVLAGGVAPM